MPGLPGGGHAGRRDGGWGSLHVEPGRGCFRVILGWGCQGIQTMHAGSKHNPDRHLHGRQAGSGLTPDRAAVSDTRAEDTTPGARPMTATDAPPLRPPHPALSPPRTAPTATPTPPRPPRPKFGQPNHINACEVSGSLPQPRCQPTTPPGPTPAIVAFGVRQRLRSPPPSCCARTRPPPSPPSSPPPRSSRPRPWLPTVLILPTVLGP
jgi:hypothetical protein